MLEGTYQDIISCNKVTVQGNGEVVVSITDEEEPVLAICQDCKCSDVPVAEEIPLKGKVHV